MQDANGRKYLFIVEWYEEIYVPALGWEGHTEREGFHNQYDARDFRDGLIEQGVKATMTLREN